MRPAISSSYVLGREVHQALDEVEAHAAHAASCSSCSSASMMLRRTVATPRALPPAALQASTMARLSAPWQVACTITLRREAQVCRAARRAAPCSRRRACTCARAHRGIRRPGRRRGSARPRCPQAPGSAAWTAGVPVEPAGGFLEGAGGRFAHGGFAFTRKGKGGKRGKGGGGGSDRPRSISRAGCAPRAPASRSAAARNGSAA